MRSRFYLDKVSTEAISITKDGQAIAMLIRPGETLITDSLLGLLKETDIEIVKDIRDMRLSV